MRGSLVKTGAFAALSALIGGVCGGVVVWMTQGHTIAVLPESISYPDLIAVLLTGVGLLLSVIGLAVAIIAIYGYQHFKKTAKTVATDRANVVAVERLQEFLDGAEASKQIHARVRELVVEILDNKEPYAAWNKESNAEAAKLDELDRSPE